MSLTARCIFLIPVLCLCVLTRADFRTVGQYDVDDGPHHNQVDQSAVYDSHTGGAGPGNIVDLAQFQTLIARAFEEDAGGVIDGEGPDDNLPSSDIAVAFFGISGLKSVSFESTSGNFSLGSGGGSGDRLPLSGDHRFAKGSTNDFVFEVGQVEGGTPEEAITFFAASLIERDNRDTQPEATVTFSDGSTVTAVADMEGDDSSPNDKDTFFGFMAPAGASIVSVDFQLNQYVHMDDIAFITSAFVMNPEQASAPHPTGGALDVPMNVSLSWTGAEGALQHDLYLSTDPNAVEQASRANPMAALVSEAQDANTYSPTEALAFGQTYYWRVDEVRGAAIDTGELWSFTVEPEAYPLTRDRVTATASSVMDPNTTGPENTIDGSGMDEQGVLHNTDTTMMWLSVADEPDASWIQYQFDKVYALQSMQVWNYNGGGINTIFGLREVLVEYSTDGEAWTPVEDVPEFAQATGLPDYGSGIVIDLGSVVAQHVRITALSNWSPGGVFKQYGLSEVQFTYTPLRARDLDPAMDSDDVDTDVTLTWRAGRQAESHDVYVGSDPNALSLMDTIQGSPYATYDTTGLDLHLGQTYYWRVDEVNELDVPSLWEGDVSSFSTRTARVLDDFESYSNDASTFSRVFQTWIDGAGYTNPVAVPGNGSGSYIGHDPGAGDIMETVSVNSGSQSAPIYYGNGDQSTSEVDRTFDQAQDWTVNGIDALVVHYQGFPEPLVQDPNGAFRLSSGGDSMMANNVTADGCRFVYKSLNGDGSIVARLESHPNVHPWGRAGVMIRESLDPGAAGVSLYDAGANGLRIGTRTLSFAAASHTGGGTVLADQLEPVWLKLERSGNDINAFYTPDLATQDWIPVDGNPRTIPMGQEVLVGMALTSRYITRPVTAVFTDVSAAAAGDWQVETIGVWQPNNTPAQLYVALEDAAGRRAIVNHEEGTAAVLQGQWTPWRVGLDQFSSVDLSQVKTVSIGINNTESQGTGLLLIDDIELHPEMAEGQ